MMSSQPCLPELNGSLVAPAGTGRVHSVFSRVVNLEVSVGIPSGFRSPFLVTLGDAGSTANAATVVVDRLPKTRPGDSAAWSDGWLRVGEELLAMPTPDPWPSLIDAAAAARLPAPAAAAYSRWQGAGSRACAPQAPALAEQLWAGVVSQTVVPAVAAVVGNGPGSTPTGDDVLIGALFRLALDRRYREFGDLGEAVLDRLWATTDVSAHLLQLAVHGFFSRPLERLGAAPGSAGALAAVLAVGATSGADALVGASWPPVQRVTSQAHSTDRQGVVL